METFGLLQTIAVGAFSRENKFHFHENIYATGVNVLADGVWRVKRTL